MSFQKSLLLLFSIILFSFSGKSQNKYNDDLIKKVGFTYFSIKDTCKESTCDSIRFVVRNPVSGTPKPLLLFIQGSGNGSIFYKGKQSVYSFITSFAEDSLIGRYVFVIISKPFTPVVADSVDLGRVYDESKPDYTKFRREDKQSYYVSSAAQVLEFMAHQPFVDSAKIFVIGHSQGYNVTAKLASTYPKRIKQIVCASSGLFDRHSGLIRQIREQEHAQIINHQKANMMIDSVYNQYYQLKGYVEQEIGIVNGVTNKVVPFLNRYSFNYEMPLDNLLKVDIPILVVYGTNDIDSIDNDLLPLFCTRAGKSNITVKSFPGYNHDFISYEYDSDGGIVGVNYNWPVVFQFVNDWIQK